MAKGFDVRPRLRLLRVGWYAVTLGARKRLTLTVLDAVLKAARLARQYDNIAYIAGPLTGMSDEVKTRYEKLSQTIGTIPGWFGYAPHLHGTDPVEHPNVSPREVRDIDFLWAVVVADMHVNCLYPIAHGNGIEAGWAEMTKIPSIYLVPGDVTPSRLVRGLQNVIRTFDYTTFDDCLPDLRGFIANGMHG